MAFDDTKMSIRLYL